MKIAILSDLHLEFGQEPAFNNVDADVLILAGDCIVAAALVDGSNNNAAMRDLFCDVFASASAIFKHVIYIAGNHEFYHGDWETTPGILADWVERWPNVHFLDNTSIDIEGVKFVGSTLWSDTSVDPYAVLSKDMLGDFRIIYNNYGRLSVAAYQQAHEECLDYVKHACSGDQPTVVVTHHSPSYNSTAARFKGSALNCFFATDLDSWIEHKENIKLWVHGHMHNPSDYQIGSTRVVCNPIGYPHEDGTATTIKIVEV